MTTEQFNAKCDAIRANLDELERLDDEKRKRISQAIADAINQGDERPLWAYAFREAKNEA